MATSQMDTFDFELNRSSGNSLEPIPNYMTFIRDDHPSFLDILGESFDPENYSSLPPYSSVSANNLCTETTYDGTWDWTGSPYLNPADPLPASSPLQNADDSLPRILPDKPPNPDSPLNSNFFGQPLEQPKRRPGRPRNRSQTLSPDGDTLSTNRERHIPLPNSPGSQNTIIAHATPGTNGHGEPWRLPATTNSTDAGNADTHDVTDSSQGQSSTGRIQGVHRAYNRVAATKYRSKRGLEEHALQEKERTLQTKHKGLVEEVQGLQEQLYALKREMFKHVDCCPRIHNYLLVSAEKVARNNSVSVSGGGMVHRLDAMC